MAQSGSVFLPRVPAKSVMVTKPRLSIGIPVYNGKEFLGELLEIRGCRPFRISRSLFATMHRQTIPKNLSTARKSRSPVRYYRNQAKYQLEISIITKSSAFAGHLYSNGPHMMTCTRLAFLEKCVKVLDENPDVVVAHSASLYVDATKQPFVFDADRRLYRDPRTGAQLTVDPPSMAETTFSIVRFADVLFNSDHSHQMYGVFRRNVLEQTRLIPPDILEGDKALLLQLPCRGVLRRSEKSFSLNVSKSLCLQHSPRKHLEFMLAARAATISGGMYESSSGSSFADGVADQLSDENLLFRNCIAVRS